MRWMMLASALLVGGVTVVAAAVGRPQTSAVALLQEAQQLRRQADQQLVAAEAACRQRAAVEPCRAQARQAWLQAIDLAQQRELTARQLLTTRND